jgi:ClpP class serine protease
VNRPRSPYVLDSRALSIAGATCRPLALSPSCIGSLFSSLRAASVAPRLALRGDEDGSEDDEEDDDEPDAAIVGNGVAIVRIDGPLAQRGELGLCAVVDGYDWISARFGAALDSARAVVLVIDSPGGDGAGLVEAVRRMRAMADEAGAPVLAYVDECAASAAYWIAAGVADNVFVPETGQVGSIGAIAVHVDVTGAADKAGEKYTLIRDPAGKAAGSALEKLDDVARSRIERDVEDLSARFAAAIAERRGLTVKAVRALDADMLQGTAAVAAGLADGVATLEQVITMAAGLADQNEEDMKLRDSVNQAFKIPATASDGEAAASVAAAIPMLDFARSAIALTGATSAEAAMGIVGGWKREAASVTELRAEIEAKKAKKAEKRRVAAITAMIGAGLPRSKMLVDPAGPIAAGNIAEPWAGMSVEMLEANAEALGGASPVTRESAPVKAPAAIDAKASEGTLVVQLTAEELHVADLLGLDPIEVAKTKAAEQRAAQREARLAGGM